MMKGILIQQNHQLMEENMSNLTSASGEAGSVSSFASPISNPVRKKRNLPGNPDPEAEVIALSPKSLMATNRFLCEICNKGFQRDQNLQLHRRGHNLPWKLKQRSSKEVRRKVYVCPEASCVHHDPSRALGDLTGVKKHFSRKHGEKKWKCDKCSKKYAVQSDWKAHSKICGTREYRCDCGTIFSRRDSFITHRAFCDALAEESSRSITENAMAAHQYPLIFSQPMMMMSSPADGLQELPLKRENHGQQQLYYNISRPEVPPCHVDLLPSSLYSHENPSPAAAAAHMSATALLQKAAQMGSTMSRPHHCQMAAHTTSAAAASIGAGFGLGTMMTNLSGSGFDDQFQGLMGSKREEVDNNNMESFVMRNHGGGGGGSGEEKTRDFLGLRQFSHREMLNLAALDPCMSTQQNTKAWQ